MVEGNANHLDAPARDGDLSVRPPPGAPPLSPAKHGFWWKVWLVVKTLQARMRFVVLLVAIGGLIAYWDTLSAYYEKWTRPAGEAEAASGDTEYFCPMHPFIVRDKPNEKCPICHMDLAKRKRGSGQAEPLPPGTVSRVQLTPYRVVLAGVQTTEVQYQPLVKEIVTYGSVEFDERKQARIAARQKGRIEKLYVNFTGQLVEKGEKLAVLDIRYSPELTVTLEDLLRARQSGNREREESAMKRLRLWDISDEQITEFLSTGKVQTKLTITSPLHGHVIKKYQQEGNYVEEGTPLYDVADLDAVWIEAQVYEADQGFLKLQQPVTATTLSVPGQDFTGAVSFIWPHLDESSRTLRVRFEMPNPSHKLRPGMYATVKIQVQPQQIEALANAPAEDTAERHAQLLEGRVLAVPESALIDTGSMKVVYRETAPNTYEGVAIQLGPRMTAADKPVAYHPILSGLKAGDRIVTNGSFLIDAETRLNPAAGSIYFGGTGGGKVGPSSVTTRPSTPEDPNAIDNKAKGELAKLGAEDRRLAEAQKFCAVLPSNRLGAMGVPIKVVLDGQPVFLCCAGCEGKAKANPKQRLQKADELKKAKGAPEAKPHSPAPPAAGGEEAEVKAALAKLGPQDRQLAEAQRLCPQSGEPLGSMGTPVKVMLKGQPVFLCCSRCETQAKANEERTLGKVKELKARKPQP
jgi:Cu(I)/Ag(I) efflux system membrane fusion protein